MEPNLDSNVYTVEKKLVALMASQDVDTREIGLQTNLIDIGYDSLKFIELVVKLEFEFGIEFDDHYLNYRHFPQVQHVVNYVEGKRVSNPVVIPTAQ